MYIKDPLLMMLILALLLSIILYFLDMIPYPIGFILLTLFILLRLNHLKNGADKSRSSR